MIKLDTNLICVTIKALLVFAGSAFAFYNLFTANWLFRKNNGVELT